MAILASIARRFGMGKLPPTIRAQLEADGGIIYLAESTGATATFSNFKAPGFYCSGRKMAFIGYLALSERRIVARAGTWDRIDLNVAYTEPRFSAISFLPNPKFLSLSYDPSNFAPKSSGHIEIRIHIPDSDKVVEILKSKFPALKP